MKRFITLLLVLITTISFAQVESFSPYDPEALRMDGSKTGTSLTLTDKLTAGEAEFGTTGTVINSAGALVMPNNTAIGVKQVGGDIKTFGFMDTDDHMNFGQAGVPMYLPGSAVYASGTLSVEGHTTGTTASFSGNIDMAAGSIDNAEIADDAVTAAKILETEDVALNSVTLTDKVQAAWADILGNVYASGTATIVGETYIGGGSDQGDYKLQVAGNIFGSGGSIVNASGSILLVIGNYSSSKYTELQALEDGVGFDIPIVMQRQGGEVLIATSTDAGDYKLQVNGNQYNSGFTKLGDAATGVKMKVLTGTTGSSEGDSVTVAHGLTSSKILFFSAIVSPSGDFSDAVTDRHYNAADDEYQFSSFVTGANAGILLHDTASFQILNKPFKFTIWYVE